MYNRIKAAVSENYLVERVLKESAKGKVVLVREKETGTRSVYREFEGSGEVYLKIQNIQCSNLPRIEAAAEKDGKAVAVEEYIQGDTLAFLLEGGALTREQAGSIFSQICRALILLHNADIIHRDIKPENIIVRGSEAVLLDFHASRVVKPEQKADTQAIGTVGYAAPEQFGFSQTDARADIYALGVLLNEMLTKKHPSKVLYDGDCLPIIQKCIEVNVDRRYSSVSELLREFEALGVKKKKSGAKITGIIVACALVIGAAAGIIASQVKEVPDEAVKQPEDSLVEETAEEPSIQLNLPEKELIDIAPEPWSGIFGDDGYPITEPTRFSYDLDGDGEKEEYLFSMSLYNDNLSDVMIIGDSVGLLGADHTVRRPVPGVWRITEDGKEEKVDDFIPLLENAKITVYRGTNLDSSAPEIVAFESPWGGGLEVLFTREHVGAWVYEVTAELGGESLRAVSKTIVHMDK